MEGGQAWVTVAKDDDGSLEALVLAQSLRRSGTHRKILVFIGSSVSRDVRQVLARQFDGVIRIGQPFGSVQDEKTRAKILCSTLYHSIRKCVFLDPRLLILQNADELFDIKSGMGLTDNGNWDTSVIVLEPTLDLAQDLEDQLDLLLEERNEANIGKLLANCMASQTNLEVLDRHYNFTVNMGSDNREILCPTIIRFGGEHPFNSVVKRGLAYSISGSDFEKELLEYWKSLYLSAKLTLEPNCIRDICTQRHSHEPLAIVGVSCRFPGANNLSEYWNVLINGQDQIGTIPPSRWTLEDGMPTTPEERSVLGGFLKCPVDEFDGAFFSMSPMETPSVDPQHRMLLEVAWEALEDAAIPPDSLRGTNAAIFTAVWQMEYFDLMIQCGFRQGDQFRPYMGNGFGNAASRLAFQLGATGPNISTESACSTSFVALGLACNSLWNHETNLALACGANLLLHPFSYAWMPLLSPDGHCKPFDSDANGYARAEGCAVLVLKRLSDAMRDNDRIYALVRGYAQAQEGLTKSMGTPTAQCEAVAIRLALDRAGVNPAQVSYVEAHGTGTGVGDPAEVEAIGEVYSEGREEPLVIGSVKGNIGHAESCSGFSGLIKTILAMENEVIPPQIKLQNLNPNIHLERIPAEIPLEPKAWRKYGAGDPRRRIAGVSAYGVTGTDAHLVVEEPPEKTGPKSTLLFQRSKEILTLSAKSGDALTSLVSLYKDYLSSMPSSLSLTDMCFTASTGRAHLPHRAVVIADNVSDLAKKLETKSALLKWQEQGTTGPPKICFLFTGQGSQYHNMGRTLYKTNPTFRQSFDACCAIFKSEYGLDITHNLWCAEPSPDLHKPINSQPSIFAIEYSLLKMWEAWGVKPDAVLGHSFGEVAATYAAGVMSLKDTIRLVVERAMRLNDLPLGKMLAVKASEARVLELVQSIPKQPDFWVDMATINTKEQTVVAGREESILTFAAFCQSQGIKTHLLDATQAFHSRDMDIILPSVKQALERDPSVEYRLPKCHYISGVDGTPLDVENGDRIDLNYWIKETRNRVKFVEASKSAYDEGYRVFLEVGPQPVLSAMMTQNTDSMGDPVTCLPSIRKTEDEWTTILNTVGKLYLRGVDIDWHQFYKHYPCQKIRLPFYPFQRKRYWFEVPKSKKSKSGLGGKQLHPLVGSQLPNPTGTTIYQNYIDQTTTTYLEDHCLGKHVIFPAAGYLEMSLAAGHASSLASFHDLATPIVPVAVEQLMIAAPMVIPSEAGTHIQTIINSPDSAPNSNLEEQGVGWTGIQIFSQQGESSGGAVKWVAHASARFSSVMTDDTTGDDTGMESHIKHLMSEVGQGTSLFYEGVAKSGLNFGPIFRSLKTYWTTETGLEALVPVPEGSGDYLCHPVLIDAMIQALILAQLDLDAEKAPPLQVPVSLGKFIWLAKSNLTCKTCLITITKKGVATLYDETGTKLAILSQVQFIKTTLDSITKSLDKQKLILPMLFEDVWRAKEPKEVSIDQLNQESETKVWLIFSQQSLLEEGLSTKLEACRRAVLKVRPKLNGHNLTPWNETSADPRVKEEVENVVRTLTEQGKEVEGIIYLLGMGSDVDQFLQGYLNLIQILLAYQEFAKGQSIPKLVTVTTGSIYLGDQGPTTLPNQGTLWGLSKTLRSEHPQIHCKCVDVDPDPDSDSGVTANQVFQELWVNDKDYQVAYRQGTRHVARLTTTTLSLNQLSLPNSLRYALVLPATKSISDLKFGQTPQQNLAKGQVEIEVKAAGLNFKDVLNVLKPDAQFANSNFVGADFSGVVTRVGGDGSKFRVGDAVLGCNYEGGALPSHICTWEQVLVPLPPDLTFEDGATLAAPFATAYQSLIDIAGLKRRETILIHTASGAVGICAIQIGQYIGAEVIATAGSKRKRAFLTSSMGLKVENVFNSRTLDYGPGILKMTQGRGVDVVLNSLTSPGFKETSLEICGPHARFIEMSKLNIWQPGEVSCLRSDVQYTLVDLSAATLTTWEKLLGHLDDFLKQGHLKPITYTRFDALNIREALSYLQKAKHVGKVVCTMPEVKVGTGDLEIKNNLFSDRSTYLITGGFGGIGLEVCKWMTDQGAKFIVLCGRSKPNQQAQEVIDTLNSSGASVLSIQSDVGNYEDCGKMLKSLENFEIPPLRGIMHAAGTLSDGLLVHQNWDKLETVFKGKVVGAWNLHQLTLAYNLEHFVLYSSIASVLGTMGQGNYAAGNAYLDNLAHYRHALGLPCTAVNWGQWGQVGMASSLEIRGMTPFTPTEGLTALELLLRTNRLQVMVADGDVSVWKMVYSWTASYLEEVKVTSRTTSAKDDATKMAVSSTTFWAELEAIPSSDRDVRLATIQKYVVSVVACILRLDRKEEVDADKGFQEMGLDSLMLIEFKNMLQALLGTEIIITLEIITDSNTVRRLTTRLQQLIYGEASIL